MILLRKVCYAYEEIPALQAVDLYIRQGRTAVLQGPNGCGKSTLLRLVNGLIFPAQGEFFFAGHRITAETMRKSSFAKWYHQKVGFIFQNSDVQLFCGSVEEEIAFGLRQMGLAEDAVNARIQDALELLQIEKLRRRAPYQLSCGEKKKVAIAAVFVMNPDVWTMDEPLTGLDTKTQQWLLEFLRALKLAGKTLLISTHDDQLARRLADDVIVMNEAHEIETAVQNAALL